MSTLTATMPVTMSTTPPPVAVSSVEEAGSTSDLENIATSPATTRRSDDSDDIVDLKFRPSLDNSGASPVLTTPQQPFKVNQAARFNPSDRWTMVKVKVSFDVTRKGERSLVIDGFKFTKSRDGMADRVFWRCSRRECKATAVTVADRVEHVRAIHEHTPPLASEFFGDEAATGDLQEVRFNTCPGGGSSLKNRHRRRTSSTTVPTATVATIKSSPKAAAIKVTEMIVQSPPTDLSVPPMTPGSVDLDRRTVTPEGKLAPMFGQNRTPVPEDSLLTSPNLTNLHHQNILLHGQHQQPVQPTYINVVNNDGMNQQVPSYSVGPPSALDPRSSCLPSQTFYQQARMLHPFLVQQQLFNPSTGAPQDSLPLNLEVHRLLPGSALHSSPPPGHTAQDSGHSMASPGGQAADRIADTPEPGECKRRQLEQMALQLLRETSGGWANARVGQFLPMSRVSPHYSPSSQSQSRWHTQDSVGSSGEFSPRISPRSTPIGQEQRSSGQAHHSLLHWKKEKIKESVEEEEENTRKRRRSEVLYPDFSESNPSSLHDCQRCWDRIKGGLLTRLLETTESVGKSLTSKESLDEIEHRCRVIQRCVSTMETVKRLKFSPETCSVGVNNSIN